MNRRDFCLASVGAAAAGACSSPEPDETASNETAPPGIIDTHIHLYDPTRPQGVPWPAADNAAIYRKTLPDRYRETIAGLGVVGAVKVECSPWVEDNDWALAVAAEDPIIVGVVGNLDPGAPDFRSHLDRLAAHPLFRGIRYGELWEREFASRLDDADFVAGFKALADADLGLDTAPAVPRVLGALRRLGEKVPDLRIVIDHLPQTPPPGDPAERRAYDETLRELAARPKTWVKISEVFRRIDGEIPTDLNFYRPRLDEITSTFGEDRVIFGSDWPNSDQWKPYPEVLGLVQNYFADKSEAARRKFFRDNSKASYEWRPRVAEQRAAAESGRLRT